MRPSRQQQRQRQSGVGLLTAIFLLVVIAGLAAAMVSVFGVQQVATGLDQRGTRAYQAARAGIEWGMFRWTQAGSCAASSSFALPATSMLSDFSVTVSCSAVTGPGGEATTVRTIRALACNQPVAGVCTENLGNHPASTAGNNLDFVQRVIEVQL